jgi:hypothetical protein
MAGARGKRGGAAEAGRHHAGMREPGRSGREQDGVATSTMTKEPEDDGGGRCLYHVWFGY